MPKYKDLTGQVINEFTPVNYLGKRGWECKCSCGNTRVVSTNALINGKRTSCGHELAAKDPNLTGRIIKKLTVLGPELNGYWRCQCQCGNIVSMDDYDLRTGKAVNCGDMTKHGKGSDLSRVKDDLTGQIFGDWEVIGYAGNGKWGCKCSCGSEVIHEVSTYDLVNGKSTSCGHGSTKFIDLTGLRFGSLEVLGLEPDGTWKCKCHCGCNSIVYKNGKYLRNGDTTSCGRKNQFKDLTGQTFGEWTVKNYVGDSLWHCECSCGVEADIHRYTLLNGTSKSCGHTRRDNLFRSTFGELKPIKYLGERKYLCRCSCGNFIEVISNSLISGHKKSCGCKTRELVKRTMLARYGETNPRRIGNPREPWQIEVLDSNSEFIELIKNFNRQYERKPNISEIACILDVHRVAISNRITELGIENLIDKSYGVSDAELNLYNYIAELCSLNGYTIHRNNRSILNGREIDIVIPELKLGFEYNGSFWHNDLVKSKKYHFDKTRDCAKNGYRLIHIFDYEYIGETREKTNRFIAGLINKQKDTIYARDCSIGIPDINEVKEFLNYNHLQGYTPYSEGLGLYYNNQLVGVITFGAHRFSGTNITELIRLAYRNNTRIIGGAEKLFKHSVEKFGLTQIISYCDLSKFTGAVYKRLGFKLDGITEPNYRWINTSTWDVLTRYQTMKTSLIAAGFGTENDTETDIMRARNYNRVYDCGNARFIWKA